MTPPLTVAQRLLLILRLAAVLCFAVALLVTLGAFTGDEQAWTDGGFLALALSFVP